MNYYHNLVTEKSWKELKELQKIVDFILIGGWAVYLYTKTLKSKDIDIIIDFNQLERLKKRYELNKNERLKKYEARREEVQIDIYLPHYSALGIPVEAVSRQTRQLEGFTTLNPECLLFLKLYTLSQRGRTPKGRKDFIDAVALAKAGVADLAKTKTLAQKYSLKEIFSSFTDFLDKYYEISELDLNRHHYAQLKKKLVRQLS